MSLQQGSQGPSVLVLQQQLISLGYSVVADGAYGPQTMAAVLSLQAHNHLQQDGIAGPDTMAIISAALADSSVRGIDVSSYQGLINWDAVKASGKVKFAIIKCTDGVGQDSRFASNLSEVQRVGLTYGAYHFFRFFSADPLSQAAQLKSSAGIANFGSGTFPICVDVEYQDVNGVTNQQVTANVAQCAAKLQTFINQVSQDFGRAPVIYTNADFWNNVLKAPNGFQNFSLWVADPNSSIGPKLPTSWNDYKLWQFGTTPAVSGITGPVDVNVVNGNLTELIK